MKIVILRKVDAVNLNNIHKLAIDKNNKFVLVIILVLNWIRIIYLNKFIHKTEIILK